MRLNDIVDASDDLFLLLACGAGRDIYGFVDMECDTVRSQVRAMRRNYIVAATEGKWDNREFEIECDLEGATLERTHLTGFGSGSLGEDNGADTTLQGALHLLHSSNGSTRIAAINKDVTGSTAGSSDKRNFAKLFLHHPLEDNGQETINEPYIEHGLVVADKDIGLAGLDVFESLNAHRQEKPEEERLGPSGLYPVDETAVRPREKDDGGDGCDQGLNE